MTKSSSPAPGKAPAAKEAAKPAKKAGEAPASHKAAQAHIQKLVDDTDIGKLVTRSKRALAKRVLERQGKVAPKDPNPEPLSDKEKKEQKAGQGGAEGSQPRTTVGQREKGAEGG